ncbi:MAG: hypothetical protein ACRDKX_07010 [Solirubrobacterales bacterium]
MRLHITVDDELVAALDRRVGPRRRSPFIAGAVRQALDDERRWEQIESALGTVEGDGHDWDEDSAGWVREQRRTDAARIG